MHILKRLLLFLLVSAGLQSLQSHADTTNAPDQQPAAALNQKADDKAAPEQAAPQVASGSASAGLDAKKERQARDLLRSVMSGSERPRVGA